MWEGEILGMQAESMLKIWKLSLLTTVFCDIPGRNVSLTVLRTSKKVGL